MKRKDLIIKEKDRNLYDKFRSYFIVRFKIEKPATHLSINSISEIGE